MPVGRVEPMQGFPEVFPVQVGIDLCGGDAFVSQHFLDGAEVGAAFDEVGGEGVTEGMGGDVLCDTGLPDEVFQE